MPHYFYKLDKMIDEYISETKYIAEKKPELYDLILNIVNMKARCFERIENMERIIVNLKEQRDYLNDCLDEKKIL